MTVGLHENDAIIVAKALADTTADPASRTILLIQVDPKFPEKTKSGLWLPPSAMKKASNTEGKHGKPQAERMYDSHFGVVIKRGSKCEEEFAVGDLIQYRPLNAYKLDYPEFQIVLIHELDYQANLGNVVEIKPPKKKAK